MRQEGYTTSEIDNDRIVKKLRGELEVMGDAEEMQAEVFSHLNTFFGSPVKVCGLGIDLH